MFGKYCFFFCKYAFPNHNCFVVALRRTSQREDRRRRAPIWRRAPWTFVTIARPRSSPLSHLGIQTPSSRRTPSTQKRTRNQDGRLLPSPGSSLRWTEILSRLGRQHSGRSGLHRLNRKFNLETSFRKEVGQTLEKCRNITCNYSQYIYSAPACINLNTFALILQFSF